MENPYCSCKLTHLAQGTSEIGDFLILNEGQTRPQQVFWTYDVVRAPHDMDYNPARWP